MNDPPVRALLVDDDEDEFVLVRSLTRAMRGLRVELEWESRFEDALARVHEHRHDVYLVDYYLGARTGLDLVREVLAARSSAPVLILTGQGGEELDLRVLHAGAADYVEKRELTASLLERSIRYALERARSVETRRLLEAARRSEELQQQVLAMVGHDLRGPLSAVRVTLEALARSDALTERHRRSATRAVHSCDRMERIIRDLTDYTRVRLGGELPVAPRPTDFAEICRLVVDEVRAAEPCRPVRAEGEPGVVGLWDPDRLGQVLHNLLGNALKYGEPGTPVDLRWHTEGDDEGGTLVVEVHNEGPPIPESLRPHLFEPFHRGDDRRAHEQSLGLGLFIVRQIVGAHGGRIAVRSAAGEGTTVVVRLPLRTRAVARVEAAASPPSA